MRWLYLAIVVVFVAALIIFVFQNTRASDVSFLVVRRHAAARRARPRRLCAGALDRRQPLCAYQAVGRRVAAPAPEEGAPLPCAPWSSPAARAAPHGGAARSRRRDRGRFAFGSKPAASAAPTCTWSTASCPIRSCRSCPGHEIVGRVEAVGEGVEPQARRAGRRGLARPYLTGPAPIAGAGARTFAMRRCSPATPATAVTRPMRSPTPASSFRSPRTSIRSRRAPLLCAGLIGWRSLKLAGDGRTHRHLWLRRRGAHHRPGLPLAGAARCSPSRGRATPPRRRSRARLGADWAGGSDETPPEPLDAAIIFAPVGALVPAALAAVRKGGRVVCGGIHMSDIPAFPYRLLWEERSVASVANLTRADGREFLALAPRGEGADARPRPIRSTRPTRRSTICARAGSRARRCSCPERAGGRKPLACL